MKPVSRRRSRGAKRKSDRRRYPVAYRGQMKDSSTFKKIDAILRAAGRAMERTNYGRRRCGTTVGRNSYKPGILIPPSRQPMKKHMIRSGQDERLNQIIPACARRKSGILPPFRTTMRGDDRRSTRSSVHTARSLCLQPSRILTILGADRERRRAFVSKAPTIVDFVGSHGSGSSSITSAAAGARSTSRGPKWKEETKKVEKEKEGVVEE
ncbi:unnamed protein product [Trichogramma brassicae]|uniref:Uncharacterized protein n=1 Tax=Trichogramma brassicae TaxID=86971 RepID=A0A6H5I381_9HYME|nr:unnamed protein product [Trichogramma brassicae]